MPMVGLNGSKGAQTSFSYLHGVDCVGVRSGCLLYGEDVSVATLPDLVQDLERALSVLEAVGGRTGDLHVGERAGTHGLALVLHRCGFGEGIAVCRTR